MLLKTITPLFILILVLCSAFLLMFCIFVHARSLYCHSRTRKRGSDFISGHIYAVGGLASNGKSVSTVEIYDPNEKKWRMGEQMSMMR